MSNCAVLDTTMEESRGIIRLLNLGRHGQAQGKLDRAQVYADKSFCGCEDCRLASQILVETSLNLNQDVQDVRMRNIYSK